MAQVRVESGRVNNLMTVANISASGVFISGRPEGPETLEVGQVVELDIFALAELDNIRVSGRVVRVEREPGSEGFAVEFTEVAADAREALERLVDLACRRSIHPPPLPQK